MNKLFYLVFFLLLIIFSSCDKDEGLIVNIDEITINEDIILGDSIMLKGENLHKVSQVLLSSGNLKLEANHLNLFNADARGDTRDWKENELLLYIPYYAELLDKNVELILKFNQNIYDGGLYNEYESGKKIKISAPSISSVSGSELTDKHPIYIVLDNINRGYSSLMKVFQYPDEKSYKYVTYSLIGDDSLKIEKVSYNGPITINFQTYLDDGSISVTHKVVTKNSVNMYYSYNLPTDQVYAPGSFMLITDDHTNVLRFSAGTVGGYTAKKSQNWSGRMGVSMPTDIPFEEGDNFEMKLLKEDDYLNIDNSHNYIELVHGNYRVVEEDENYIYYETNVYYSYLSLSYAIVTSESDTVSYDYRTSAYYEASSESTFGLGIEKNGMPQGDHQLLIYSKDKNYQLKPAGDISFSVK